MCYSLPFYYGYTLCVGIERANYRRKCSEDHFFCVFGYPIFDLRFSVFDHIRFSCVRPQVFRFFDSKTCLGGISSGGVRAICTDWSYAAVSHARSVVL